jgi:p-hydroxybenzoate 3-monooxygenase
MSERTEVAIIGAGPAGLLLGRMLELRGIETVILEVRDRAYVHQRQRAGILENDVAGLLDALGVGERMHREGFFHDGIELLVDGVATRIDFSELTGRRVALWPQTELVKDLIAARVATGAPLHFAVADVSLHDLDTSQPHVRYRDAAGTEHELRCAVVAGCDGFHGICRASIPAATLQIAERTYPFGWLGILADVAPSCDELIYASTERGFALHSMRTATLSRLYLQVASDDHIANWSDERIWDELQHRLARDGWTLEEGPITDKAITPMRSFVAGPMVHGRLVLAGDAAHIVPPTGAKGLNLAAADVRVLADALEALCRSAAADAVLTDYSTRALHRVWRAEHFSWWMTSMLHRFPNHDAFERALQRSQLDYITSSRAASTTLAENYVGLPL